MSNNASLRLPKPGRLIGLTGYARSGKNTAAKALVDDGWVEHAFADKLREAIYDFNPALISNHSAQVLLLQDVIDRWGWEGVKNSYEWARPVREALQNYGQTIRQIHSEFWVDCLRRTVVDDLRKGTDAVITDVRYSNEVLMVRKLGGFVFRIQRPGVGPLNDHGSEQLDFRVDATLTNEGTPEELQAKLRGRAEGML